jgi:uncharacterized RDD family membrane protein YckC
MDTPRITLQSVTGVDIELTVAGPGSRSYAFIIDWHIRIVLALACFFVATFVVTGSWFGEPEDYDANLLWIVAPGTIIYFFYHPILEIAMRGRTPGKRIAGVRLVTREGDIPGIGALLLRNVFRVLDSLPGVYLVGLLTVMFTQHHVRVGDLAAGTVLVLDHDAGASSFVTADASLNAQSADLIRELLDRWPALDAASRSNIARSLLARVDRTLSATELAQLDERALRERLAARIASA